MGHDVRLFGTESLDHPGQVVGEHLHRESGIDDRIALAKAAHIDGDTAADVGKALELIEPQAVIEREAMHEQRERAVAHLAVEEHVAVDPGKGHLFRLSSKYAFGIILTDL